MVLSIAALVGIAGTQFGAYAGPIETAGTCVSIAVLVLITILNMRQLRADSALKRRESTSNAARFTRSYEPVGRIARRLSVWPRLRNFQSNRYVRGLVRRRQRRRGRRFRRHDVLSRYALHRHPGQHVRTSADFRSFEPTSGDGTRLDLVRNPARSLRGRLSARAAARVAFTCSRSVRERHDRRCVALRIRLCVCIGATRRNLFSASRFRLNDSNDATVRHAFGSVRWSTLLHAEPEGSGYAAGGHQHL